MGKPLDKASHQAWLAMTEEEVLEPALPIIDAHHHLWLDGYGKPVPWQPDYWHEEHAKDLASGHNVRATIFVECGYGYRQSGWAELRPVGETVQLDRYGREFRQRTGLDCQAAAAIVGFADLRLGAEVDAVLEAHLQASDRFRGIRQIVNWDASEEVRYPGFQIAPGLLLDARFMAGFARLARYGLSFDAWLFHPQLPELVKLAQRFPDTTIVLDHAGRPVGIGPYAGKREEVLRQWRAHIGELAKLPNVFVKIGGLNMEHAGLHWHERARPPTSDELLAANAAYIDHVVAEFGPERCMLESNFPVDKVSCSYRTVWNMHKKATRALTPSERSAMFHGTAQRVYRLTALSEA
jgi:L-fuconolactonase